MTTRRGILAVYDPKGFYCEMLGNKSLPAAHTEPIRARLSRISMSELKRRARDSERELYNLGITFTVYSDCTAPGPWTQVCVMRRP